MSDCDTGERISPMLDLPSRDELGVHARRVDDA
jgi:hypothetical protein